MRKELLKTIGSVLWWAEGTKARRDKRYANTWMYHVDFTNTDPEMINLFLEYLRDIVGIDEGRLKLQLQIHTDDNLEELERFWSRRTRIPRTRFYRTIVRPAGNKAGKTRGTCKIRYCDKKTYLRMVAQLNDVVARVGYTTNR
jgi:hypothetical protein